MGRFRGPIRPGDVPVRRGGASPARPIATPVVIDVGRVVRPPVDIDLIPPFLPTSRLVLRPRDLVVLEVSWQKLRLVTGDKPRLQRTGSGQGLLIVRFPPQNLAEKAYFQASEGIPANQVKAGAKPGDPDYLETVPVKPGAPAGGETPEPPPIDALISDESRLVLLVPEGYTIPFSVEGILQACRDLDMRLAPNALPPGRRLVIATLPADVLLGTGVAATARSGRIDRLVTASRLRTAVLGRNPFLAEAAAGLRGALPAHRVVATDAAPAVVEGIVISEEFGFRPAGVAETVREALRLRPKPREPRPDETALETPYRLQVSPNRFGAWAHALTEVDHNGRVELWHTRLGVRGPGGEVDEESTQNRAIRAIWTRGQFDPNDTNESIPAFDPDNALTGFRMSLDQFDRANIVHLSSNFGIVVDGRRYVPEVVEVERLMLTSLGSWMDVRGAWDPDPPGLSVEEWIHRGTLGRDHFVRVVYRGYLVPFGHRASLIKITERRFHPDFPGNTAYLRQRMYIVVKEPIRHYGNASLTFDGNKNLLRSMPLRSVRITSLTTPDLDMPSATQVQGQSRKAFWPYVAGAPFRFKFVATDIAGGQREFDAPLIWVDKAAVDDTTQVGGKRVVERVLADYEAGGGFVPSGAAPSEVGMGGQEVVYAAPGKADDTTFETASITFGAEYLGHSSPYPRFHPTIRRTALQIQAVKQIAGTDEPSILEFAGAFLEQGFGGANKGEVLFAAAQGAAAALVDFASQSDRSGGLVSPNVAVSGISRLAGPVSGALDKATAGTFDPASFFSGLDAKIFGVIDLVDILQELDFFDDLGKMPRFVGQALNRVESFLNELERLRALIEAQTALWSQVETEIDAVVDEVADLLAGQGTGTLGDLLAALGAAAAALEAAVAAQPGLTAGLRQEIVTILQRIQDVAADAATLVDLIEDFVNGIEMAKSLEARFEWRPEINGWPAGPTDEQIFRPRPDGLVLLVEAAGANGSGAPRFSITASLEEFSLHLIAPATVIVIPFEKLQFRVVAGRKPEIDVVMGEITFDGPLKFVNTIKDLIPLDGFSDPPDVTVDAEGITAGFTLGLPNVSVGVFSIENMSLGAGFAIPFIGEPLSVWFKFCERENPALVTVSLFGGGFFFGVTLDPAGLRILEAAIEFGANCSMDFGVASGGVSVMAGIYFKLEQGPTQMEATLVGYFRARGHVQVLGIVSVSIELYLELSYEFASEKAVGRASLKIEIDVFLFSVSVTIECEKKFAGSSPDPTFAETMAPYQLDPADPATLVNPWEEYCAAFA